MSESGPAAADWPNLPAQRGGSVFSTRLESFLDQLQEGETPNSGRFCAVCYNPLPSGLDACDNCGSAQPAITSLPGDILDMHIRKRKRESVVVNSFAYLGLGMGLALFLILVAINVLYLEKAFWFFIFATVVFLVGSRLLAGIVGGVVGDEIGYRYANKKLAQEWQAHLAQRNEGTPA